MSEAGGARARRVVIVALRGCNRSCAGDFRHEHFGRRSDFRSDAGAGKIEQSAIRRQVEAVPKQLGFRHAHVEARMADRVPAHGEGISRRLPLMAWTISWDARKRHRNGTAGNGWAESLAALSSTARSCRCSNNRLASPSMPASQGLVPDCATGATRAWATSPAHPARDSKLSMPSFYDPILAAERGWRSNNPVLVPLQRATCVGCVTILAAMPRRQSGSAAGSSTCMRALRSQWQGRRMIIALHQRSVMPRA